MINDAGSIFKNNSQKLPFLMVKIKNLHLQTTGLLSPNIFFYWMTQ